MKAKSPNIGLQRTSACGLAAEAGSLGVAITIFLAASLNATEKPAASQATLAGCYIVSAAEWSPSVEKGQGEFWAPPRAVKLTSAHVAHDPEQRWMVMKYQPAAGQRVGQWRVESAGTISISISDGFTGLSGELAPVGDYLQGTLTTWEDGNPSFHRKAVVKARRTACKP